MVRIQSIRIKNFRSFGPGRGGNGSGVFFDEKITYVVGENNAGKTNLLRALKRTVELAASRSQPDPGQPNKEEFHLEDSEIDFLLTMKVEFDSHDFEFLVKSLAMTDLGSRKRVASALRVLIPTFEFSVAHPNTEKTLISKLGNWYLSGVTLFPCMPDKRVSGFKPIGFKDLLPKLKPKARRPSLKAAITAYGLDSSDTYIMFDIDIFNILVNRVRKCIGVFDEVRFRPEGTGDRVTESYDGGHVADLLFTLKNGTREDRERWERIRRTFRQIFPHLDLEVIQTRGKSPQVTIEHLRSDFEIAVSLVGAGIGEVITLLAHMVGAKGSVFAIDTPEAHLHPHALRTLLSFFDDVAKSNQLIVATHSPLVPCGYRIRNTIVVREAKTKTTVNQLKEDDFSPEDFSRLEVRLGPEAREFLFAKKVVFVEGATEIGALPILAKGVSRDPDRIGISFVSMGGKHFAILVQAAKKLGVSRCVVCDYDALMRIESSIRTKKLEIPTSTVIAQLYELDELSLSDIKYIRSLGTRRDPEHPSISTYPKNQYGRLSDIAQKSGVFVWDSTFDGVLNSSAPKGSIARAKRESRSKVIRGRILAQSIIDEGHLTRSLESRLRQILRL